MFNTLPYNSFPASTAKFEEGKNDTIQAEIDAIKDGTNIDSFGDVETELATKTNLSNIAPTFDSESGTYDIGEQVIYEGVLYEFISAHDTPGDWDSTEVHAVKISELIDTLNSNFANLNSAVTVLNDRQIVIRLVTSDTIDQATTATLPSGYDCARAVITGYAAKRTNNIWYANDGQVEAGAWANTIYVKPKSADNLECPVDIVLSKFYYDT